MKKVLKVGLVIIIIILIIMAALFFYVKTRPLPVIEIGNVEISKLQDGRYTGEYEIAPVKAVVNVEVKDKKIVSIEIIEHENGLGKKAEKITEAVVKAQSLEVEAVSGATYSSKVILKAIEAALEKGKI